jgi:hypothetical protein
MIVPLACGGGSSRWLGFGEPLRFLESFNVSSWVTAGIILGTFGVGFVIVVGAFALSTAIESWRQWVPVPQVANPVLEGATRDLAQAVEVLRLDDNRTRAAALLELAKAKSVRASGRLSRHERRRLARAWRIVRWSGA